MASRQDCPPTCLQSLRIPQTTCPAIGNPMVIRLLPPFNASPIAGSSLTITKSLMKLLPSALSAYVKTHSDTHPADELIHAADKKAQEAV